jgi:Amt family ammonium transporter
MAFLRGVNLMAPSPNDSIPLIVHVAYQMMFAIITPALITGAFANRVTFKAYFIFLTLWLLLVYFPFVHMLWGGGLLAKWGVLDFAGGIVVHNIARIGPRIRPLRRPAPGRGQGMHSIRSWPSEPSLWFGWYGSTLEADSMWTRSRPQPSSTDLRLVRRHVLVRRRMDDEPKPHCSDSSPDPSRGWRLTPAAGFISPGLGHHRDRRGCRLLLP